MAKTRRTWSNLFQRSAALKTWKGNFGMSSSKKTEEISYFAIKFKTFNRTLIFRFHLVCIKRSSKNFSPDFRIYLDDSAKWHFSQVLLNEQLFRIILSLKPALILIVAF